MEIIRDVKLTHSIKIAIFDFDGTISTLRSNWESIMEKLMLELIHPLGNGKRYPQSLIDEVKEYINDSTGIQTAYQMEWLKGRVESYHRNPIQKDIWWYKEQYNVRLLEMVNQRLRRIANGEVAAEEYRIMGSLDFVKHLWEQGVEIYIASGTDHHDLVNEVGILGLAEYVKEVRGAPERAFACSKEEVLNHLLDSFEAEQVAIFGDGKVEIQLGHDAGALVVATATNEQDRKGISPVKRDKLIKAGADIVVGDFLDKEGLLKIMNLSL